MVTVVEGRNLTAKDKSGKCNPYVKLQYGKVECIIILCQITLFSAPFFFLPFVGKIIW